MKFCRECGLEKPFEDYYRHSQMADGHLNICKDCVKARIRRHRRMNESVRAYDRKRAKSTKRAAFNRLIAKRWRKENPAAYKAQTAVGNAIRDGKLQKEPCYFCGAKNVHAHHADYADALNVTWLCPKCHHRLHAMEGAA